MRTTGRVQTLSDEQSHYCGRILYDRRGIVGATIAADLGTYLNEFVPKGRSYASIGFLAGIAVIGIIVALQSRLTRRE